MVIVGWFYEDVKTITYETLRQLKRKTIKDYDEWIDKQRNEKQHVSTTNKEHFAGDKIDVLWIV